LSAADIVQRTRDYERWMVQQSAVVAADLRLKHRLMAEAPFPFFRATFYRWADLWQATCAELDDAPKLLAVGDLHIENFGTWRDAEGRLVWGVNDFDEVAVMPFTIDLVRLATSAVLAGDSKPGVAIAPRMACDAILDGYCSALAAGGKAFVLEEAHPGLRAMAYSADRDPVRFWEKMNAWPTTKAPADIRKRLAREMPEPDLRMRIAHRVAGLGALGRPRFVALASWRDGMVAREAKRMLPSAYLWALGRTRRALSGGVLAARAVRCPDPFLRVDRNWQLRRLAPHCSRIELAGWPRERDEERLLRAMGRETANLHLGTPNAVPRIRAALKRLKRRWLVDAATGMAEATLADWRAWRKAGVR